jgi:hypothetical protein
LNAVSQPASLSPASDAGHNPSNLSAVLTGRMAITIFV